MKQTNKKYIILLIFCCLIWGSTFTVIKDITTKVDPYLLSALRNWIAVTAFLIYLIFTKKLSKLKNKTAVKYGVILGAIIGIIYIVQTIGLSITSSTHSAFITSSAVILVPILLLFSGQNKLDKTQIITIGIVGIGIYYLTNGNGNSNYNFGDVLTLICAVICALNIILSGEYVRKSELNGIIFYQFLFAGIISTIALGIKTGITKEEIIFKWDALPSLLYLSLIGTLLCYFIMIYVQQYISTILTAMILSFEPIFATTASYFYTGETITLIELFGGLLIISGITYYNIKSKKNKA
jgi:drug/metabolite transporter (DMT)-like permease